MLLAKLKFKDYNVATLTNWGMAEVAYDEKT